MEYSNDCDAMLEDQKQGDKAKGAGLEGQLDWARMPTGLLGRALKKAPLRARGAAAMVCRAWREEVQRVGLEGHVDARDMSPTAIRKFPKAQTRQMRSISVARTGSALALAEAAPESLERARVEADQQCDGSAMGCLVGKIGHSLRELDLGDMGAGPRIPSSALPALAAMSPNLEVLRIASIAHVMPQDVERLTHMPRLTELCIEGADIRGARVLALSPSLRRLALPGCEVLEGRNDLWEAFLYKRSARPPLEAIDASRQSAPAHPSQEGATAIVANLAIAIGSPGISCAKEIAAEWARSKEILRKCCSGDRGRFAQRQAVQALLREAQHGRAQSHAGEAAEALVRAVEEGLEATVIECACFALGTLGNSPIGGVDQGAARVAASAGVPRALVAKVRNGGTMAARSAAKALAHLCAEPNFASDAATCGAGVALKESVEYGEPNEADEAASALWNMSVGEVAKARLAEAGCAQALLRAAKSGGASLRERALGALANMAADPRCAEIVAMEAVQTAADECFREPRSCVSEQAGRLVANLAAQAEECPWIPAACAKRGAVQALVRTVARAEPIDPSASEACGALWNLSFDSGAREEICSEGGVEALAELGRALALRAPNDAISAKERVAGALWGLSIGSSSSMKLPQAGALVPLVSLARCPAHEVQEAAAGTFWNLAYANATAQAIASECECTAALREIAKTGSSPLARFMGCLALACLLHSLGPDGRENDLCAIRDSLASATAPSEGLDGETNAEETQRGCISVGVPQASWLRCSQTEMGAFGRMLLSPLPELRWCSAFALAQFLGSGRHAPAHRSMLLSACPEAPSILSGLASSEASHSARAAARAALEPLLSSPSAEDGEQRGPSPSHQPPSKCPRIS